MQEMTPAAWLEYLDAKLEERRPKIEHYVNYRRGNHRLASVMSKYSQDFRRFLGPHWSDNWCKPVVEVAVERLKVEGLDFGSDEANDKAWAIWKSNRLPAKSRMAHRDAITCGESYALVAPRGNGLTPRITIEHATQVIVAMSEDDPDVRAAALKKWVGRDGYVRATLYLPDWVHRFRSVEKYRSGRKIQWTRLDGLNAISNPTGVVLMVPLLNMADTLEGGTSDLDGPDDLNDVINLFALQMAVSGHLLALPQRIIAGIEVPTDPLTGRPMSANFEHFVSKLMTVKNPNVTWGQFDAADLTNFKTAIDLFLQHLAAQSRTPPHYLIGQVVNASGDALKAAETGLTERCREKVETFGEGWEETMRVAFLAAGNTELGTYMGAESMWKDPENKSEAQVVDAAVKKLDAGVPYEQVWKDMGYTQQQIRDFKVKRGLPRRPGDPPDPTDPPDEGEQAAAAQAAAIDAA